MRSVEKASLNLENIRKILVATDGSSCSMRAAESAINIAKMFESQIIVVYVINEVVLDEISKITEREEVERELKQDGPRNTSIMFLV